MVMLEGQDLKVKGPLRELSRTYPQEVILEREESRALRIPSHRGFQGPRLSSPWLLAPYHPPGCEIQQHPSWFQLWSTCVRFWTCQIPWRSGRCESMLVVAGSYGYISRGTPALETCLTSSINFTTFKLFMYDIAWFMECKNSPKETALDEYIQQERCIWSRETEKWYKMIH